MGDVCDMNDLDRFMRSAEGHAHLEDIRRSLVGRTIADVDFVNEFHHAAMHLRLSDGSTFTVADESLEVESLREAFAEAIDREYRRDYPERVPPKD